MPLVDAHSSPDFGLHTIGQPPQLYTYRIIFRGPVATGL
jgi:hypothetical protein